MTKKTVAKKAPPKRAPTKQDLQMQIEELRSHLEEAQEALHAIQSGEAAAAGLRQVRDELRERVKELTALHGASRILQDDSKTIPEAMQAIVALIPPAMRYPEIAAARIILDDQEFTTPNFAISRRSLWSDWTVNGQRGIVEVYYLEQRPPQAIGPFLAEERILVNTLAEMLRAHLERKQAQDELYQAYTELETRVEERTAELRQANETAQQYAEQLRTANEQLREQAEELEVTMEELAAQNDELCAARQQVEVERQRYQELFDFAPGGYLVTDARGTIREANRAAAQMLNVRADRLEGKPLTAFVDEPEHGTLYAQLVQLQQAQETLQWEMRLQPCKGAPLPALIDVAPTRDAKGQITGLRWLLRDITERKQVEMEIASLAKFPSENPNPVLRLSQDGLILYANEGSTPLLCEWGCAMGEYAPAYWRGLASETLASRSSQTIEDTCGGRVYSFFTAPIVEQGYVNLYAWDITERKRMEEALHESEERYRTLFETMTQGVVYQDADGKITLANPAAERILGLTLDQMQGRTSMDPRWKAIHEDGSDFPGETHPAMTALQTGAPVENIVMGIFNPQAQEYRWASIDAVPQFKPGEEKPYQVYTTFDDITERRRMEEALKASEERARDQAVRLQAVLDATPAIIWIAHDRECRSITGNRAAQELLRVSGGTDMSKSGPSPELLAHYRVFKDGGELAPQDMPIQRVAASGQGLGDETMDIVFDDGAVRSLLGNVTPVPNAKGQPNGAIAAFLDITERREWEEELARLNRTLAAHSHSDQALMRATAEAGYMEEVCNIVVQDCGHAMVWIGFAEEDEAKSVRPVAYAGFEEGYLETLNLAWADTERGRGPTGTAIRTGQPSFCRNMLTDPKFTPWRAEALKRGYASSLALPLLDGDRAFGALNIYFQEPDPFTEDEIALLSGLADDLAYGIKTLRLRAAHEQAEAALRESEQRYHTLFEGMTEGFGLHEIICDEQGQPCDYRFLEINPAFERLTGLRREDVIGKTHNEVLPDDSPLWVEMYGLVALTGQPVHFENYSPALERHYDVFVYRPAPRQFAVLFMDITERKQAEAEREQLLAQLQESTEQLGTANEQLRERTEELEVTMEELASQNDELRAARQQVEAERQRYQELFDFAPGGYLVTDARGTIREANRAAAQMLNVRADRLEGKPLIVYVAEQEHTALHAQLAQLQEKQGILQWETRLQPRENAAFPALIDAAPMRDAQGQLTGLRWLLRDVTERKRAEQEREWLLEQVNTLAHNLQTERDTLDIIMENTRTQLAYLDPQMNFVRVNSAYAQGSGHTKEELLGRNHFEWFPNAENQAIFERARDTGQPVEFRAKPFEYADQPERGVTYWDWTLVPVKDPKGRVQGLVFSLADVTQNVQAAQERERLLEQNLQQRRLLETLFEAEPDALTVVTGEELAIQMANPAYRAIMPRPTEDPVGQRWDAVWAGAVRRETLSVIRSVMLTGEPVDEESQKRIYPDGQTRYFSFHARRLLWNAEYAALIVLQETTAIEQARQDAQRRAAELDAVITSIADGVMIHDMAGDIARMNPAAERIMGYSQEERRLPLAERTTEVMQFTRADSQPITDARAMPMPRALRGEIVSSSVMKLQHLRTGRSAWVLVSAAPIRMPGGAMLGAVSTFTDITELRQTQERLEQSNERLQQQTEELEVQAEELQVTAQELSRARDELERRVQERTAELEQSNAELRLASTYNRTLLEASLDPLVTIGPDGKITDVNPATEIMTGRSRAELLGTDFADYFTQPEKARVGYQQVFHEERIHDYELAVQHRDGRVTPVLYNASVYRDEAGQVAGVFAAARDITERVRAYQLLEQRVEERTRELATLLDLSHNMASTLELDPLLGLILDQLKRIVSYTGAAILMLEGESMTVVEYRGSIPRDEVVSTRFPLKEAVGWSEVVDDREPVVIADLEGDSPLARAYREAASERQRRFMGDARSWLGVPLIVRNQVIGALRLSHVEPDHFSPQHVRLAVALANQAAVAIENARLYEQAQELAAVEERQRLARELHDSVSQAFYGISLGAHTALTLLDSNRAKVVEALSYVLSLTDAGLTEMRALIFDLRPDSLELEGLTVALARQMAAIRARHGIEVGGELCDEPTASLKIKEAIYRIAQEALTNAVKHARATKLNLWLRYEGESIVLEVKDDGVGFDPTSPYPGHLGLHSMRERVARLGGTLDIQSAPGQGTRIRARFSL
jgi:PAS domain S-box-containing protein